MKKLLLASFLLLFTINSNANVFLASWNVEGYSQSTSPKGVNIAFTKGVAKELRIQFNMTRDQGTGFNSFKYEIQHTSLNGTRTRIPGASYLNYNWGNSYSLGAIFSFTIPADKTEGEISLVLISYSGSQFMEAVCNGSYTLNYTQPPVNPNTVNNRFLEVHNSDGTQKYKTIRYPHMIPPTPGGQEVFYPSNTPVLVVDQALYSPNRKYFLILQSDGNLVLYKDNWQVIWDSGTQNKGGKYLYFHPDGNLVMYKNANATEVVWASSIYVPGGDFLLNQRMYYQLQDDGNFVFYWNGVTFTDGMGTTGTFQGVKSPHFGKIQQY